MMPLYEFEGKRPMIGDGTYIHPQAVIIGSVSLGRGCFIGAGAVLRADFGDISIGNGSNVQENAVLHASPFQPILIDDDVIFAHGALMHDAVIKRGVVVGMGVIILHGVVVEEDAILGAGAVLAPGFICPARKMVMGAPARVVKDVTDEMLEITKLGLAEYQALPGRFTKGLKQIDV